MSEPEDMTGVMGWSQRSRGYGVRVRGYGVRARGYGVRARQYHRNFGLEPEDMVSESMTGVMGWSQRIVFQSQRI